MCGSVPFHKMNCGHTWLLFHSDHVVPLSSPSSALPHNRQFVSRMLMTHIAESHGNILVVRDFYDVPRYVWSSVALVAFSLLLADNWGSELGPTSFPLTPTLLLNYAVGKFCSALLRVPWKSGDCTESPSGLVGAYVGERQLHPPTLSPSHSSLTLLTSACVGIFTKTLPDTSNLEQDQSRRRRQRTNLPAKQPPGDGGWWWW